jgi:hypothetical protein
LVVNMIYSLVSLHNLIMAVRLGIVTHTYSVGRHWKDHSLGEASLGKKFNKSPILTNKLGKVEHVYNPSSMGCSR